MSDSDDFDPRGRGAPAPPITGEAALDAAREPSTTREGGVGTRVAPTGLPDRFTRPSSDLSRPEPRAVPLRRDEALALLREHALEIERRTNIRPVALFGSVARDEATTDSDVDVLAETVGQVGWTELAQAEVYLEVLFAARVDLVFWDTLKPRVRPYIARDLLRVA